MLIKADQVPDYIENQRLEPPPEDIAQIRRYYAEERIKELTKLIPEMEKEYEAFLQFAENARFIDFLGKNRIVNEYEQKIADRSEELNDLKGALGVE